MHRQGVALPQVFRRGVGKVSTAGAPTRSHCLPSSCPLPRSSVLPPLLLLFSFSRLSSSPPARMGADQGQSCRRVGRGTRAAEEERSPVHCLCANHRHSGIVVISGVEVICLQHWKLCHLLKRLNLGRRKYILGP